MQLPENTQLNCRCSTANNKFRCPGYITCQYQCIRLGAPEDWSPGLPYSKLPPEEKP